jgi:tetratricopeptide (TPR) repeat protein
MYVLLGHLHHKKGNTKASIAAYEAALHISPQGCPLDVYIRLGHAYLERNEAEHAADVFGQACIAKPSSATWLGVGIASLRLGKLEDADVAFAEGNVYDPRNPQIWGYLALAHVLSGRNHEAAQVRAVLNAYIGELCKSSTSGWQVWTCAWHFLIMHAWSNLQDWEDVTLRFGDTWRWHPPCRAAITNPPR